VKLSWLLLLVKSHRPPLCHIPLKPKYGLTPISCHAALERSACALFIKERRMECINATSLRRKSGQWGTQRLLPVIGNSRKFRRRQLSNPLPVPAANAGCPIQAVLWLEWDMTDSLKSACPGAALIPCAPSFLSALPRDRVLLPSAASGSRPSLHQARVPRTAAATAAVAWPVG
jgi:hypothetical protein